MKNVIIIGASGHGKAVADVVIASKDKVVGFLDDDITKNTMGVVADYIKYKDCEFILGIGNTAVREKLSALPVKWYTAIHPSAVISPSAKIKEGSVVMPNSVINAQAEIGKHCIINTCAVVEHDNVIGNFSHVSVGTVLGGNVKIGKSVWVGIGAVVSNNISICDNSVIGAGAVVVKDITEKGIYVGVPARRKI